MKKKILPVVLASLLLTSCAGGSHNKMATKQKMSQIQQNNTTINSKRQEHLNNISSFASKDLFSIADTIFLNNEEGYEIEVKITKDKVDYIATIRRVDFDIIEVKLSTKYEDKNITGQDTGSIILQGNGSVEVFSYNEEGAYSTNASNETLRNMNNILNEIGEDNFYRSLDEELDKIIKEQNKKM